MKKFVLPLLGALLTAALAAATSYRSLVIHRADDSVVAVNIEENMTTSVADGNLQITNGKHTLSLPVGELTYWNFSTEAGPSLETAGIETVSADRPQVTITLTGSTLQLSGLPAGGCRVSLFATDGRLILDRRVSSGETSLDISGLAPALYILRYDKYSLKISLGR